MASSVLAEALGLHGDNPEELPLFTGDLQQYQEDVLAQNKKITPEATQLADLVNTSNTQQLLKMMEAIMPGYQSILKTGLGNAEDLMKGKLPQDVQDRISDYGAARGITSGTSGSQFADYSTLRSLGISSLEAEGQGLNQFLNIAQRAPKAPMFDFTSMFLTPAQKAQFELTKYQTNLPVMQFNNWVRSLPSHLEKASGMFLDWLATEGTSVLNMYTGAGMGGGGGGMGGMMGGMGGGGGSGPGGAGQGAGQGTGEGGAMGGPNPYGQQTGWTSPYGSFMY